MSNHPQSELKIPVGIQGLPQIIATNRRYIDKTPYISSWAINGAAGTNILHRPRRFGKTLTLSVVEALYSHQKNLFKNTSLPDSFWDTFEYHPVISFHLAVSPARKPLEDLENLVHSTLKSEMKRLKIFRPEDEELSAKNLLSKAIDLLGDQDPEHLPVILIDEYDSLVNHAYEYGQDLGQAADVVADYIHPLKYKYKNIHAAYVIGIMKYQGLKLMSSVNNPIDRTFHPDYAQMIGFTMEEIQTYFPREIEKLAGVHKMSTDEIINKIKTYYNGYCFSPEALEKTVYAGFSFCTFADKAYCFGDFWYSTGGINTLYEHGQSQLFEIEELIKNGTLLASMAELERGHNTQNSNQVPLHTLLYYHGYLTLQTCNGNEVGLGIPNEEVLRSFQRSYAENILHLDPFVLEQGLILMKKYIRSENIEALIYVFAQIFSGLPGKLHLHAERYYQSIIMVLLQCIYGSDVHAERPLATGIPDIVLKLKDMVYLFEFKFVSNSKEENNQRNEIPLIAALKNAKAQVISKRYLEAYRTVPSIYAIALVISQKEHNLAGYMVIEAPTNNPAAELLHTPIFLSPEKIKQMGDQRAQEKAEEQRGIEPIEPQEPYIFPVPKERLEAFDRFKNASTQREHELEKQLILAQAALYAANAQAQAALDAANAQAQAALDAANAQAARDAANAQAARDAANAQAQAAWDVEKAKAQAAAKNREMQMKLIFILQKKNCSSAEICRIAGFTFQEWEDLTGEKLTLQ